LNEFSFRIISIVSIVESKHDLRDYKELYVFFYRHFWKEKKERERGSNFDKIIHTIPIIDLGHFIIVA